ncbi:MAG: hypothetical protein HY447_04805 [Candidatus Omnitrophica bacterium]|nr:hypothetical protein [Candidatus Omnitrophota bacterium]
MVKSKISVFCLAVVLLFNQVVPLGFAEDQNLIDLNLTETQTPTVGASSPTSPTTSPTQPSDPLAAFMEPNPISPPEPVPSDDTNQLWDPTRIRTVEELIKEAIDFIRKYLNDPNAIVELKKILKLPFSSFDANGMTETNPALPTYRGHAVFEMKSGNQTYTLQFSPDQTLLTQISTYDSEGNKIEEKSFGYYSDGSLASETTIKYDKNGNVIEITSVGYYQGGKASYKSRTRYFYDSQNRLLLSSSDVVYYDADGKFTDIYVTTTKNVYDSWGLSHSETASFRNGRILYRSSSDYFRDNKGRDIGSKSKWEMYDENGNVTSRGSYVQEKKYNSNGNLIYEHSLYESNYGGTTYRQETTRTLTYNSRGKLLEERTESHSESAYWKYTWISFHRIQYDTTGLNAIREVFGYVENGQEVINTEIVRTFNARGLVTSETSSSFYQSKLTSRTTTRWIYNWDGKVVSKTTVSSYFNYSTGEEYYRSVVIERFNAKGQLVSVVNRWYYWDGQQLRYSGETRETFQYQNGHLLTYTREELNAEGILLSRTVKKYDPRFSTTDPRSKPTYGIYYDEILPKDSWWYPFPDYYYHEPGLLSTETTYYSTSGTPFSKTRTGFSLNDKGEVIERKGISITYHPNGQIASELMNRYALIKEKFGEARLRLVERRFVTFNEAGIRISSLHQVNKYDEHGVIDTVVTTLKDADQTLIITDVYDLDAKGQYASVKRTVRDGNGKLIREEEWTVEYDTTPYWYWWYDEPIITKPQPAPLLLEGTAELAVTEPERAAYLVPPFPYFINTPVKNFTVKIKNYADDGVTVKESMNVNFAYSRVESPCLTLYPGGCSLRTVAHVTGTYLLGDVVWNIDTRLDADTGFEWQFSTEKLMELIRRLALPSTTTSTSELPSLTP